MAWKVEYAAQAVKDLRKLGPTVAARIDAFLHDRVAASGAPRSLGQALSGQLKGRWRYRVGDYRVVCEIEDDRLVVLVVRVGDRKEVYR